MKGVSLPRLATVAPLAFVALAAVYPLARFLLLPLIPSWGPPQDLQAGGTIVLSMEAIVNSARIGIETGVAALVPGFAMGFLLERKTWRWSGVLVACLWIIFLTPTYLFTTGWQIVMSTTALRHSWPRDLFFSEAGIVAVMAIKGFPLACLTARTGWATIGGEIGAAARLHIRDPWRRARLLGWLLAPVASAAFAIVFIEAIGDFGVAATLGAEIHLPLVIFAVFTHLARTPVDFIGSASLSLILVAMAGLAVGLHQISSSIVSPISGRSRPAAKTLLTRAESIAAGIALAGLAIVAIGIPALALFGQAAMGDQGAPLTAAELASLLYSVCYAGLGSGFSLLLALALLTLGARGWKSDAALNGLTIGAMAVPGVVFGAAYVIAFNGALPLFGTPLLLVMGYIATHAPILMRFLQAPLRSAHANMRDAAKLHGLGRWARIEMVHAPILLRPLLWAWAVGFGGIFFEMPLSALLHPIGRASLGVQLLLMDESLRFTAEARLALIGGALCLGIVGLVVAVLPALLTQADPVAPETRKTQDAEPLALLRDTRPV